MRDGTILRADVYRPDTSEQCPVLITRSPYNKSHPDMYTYFDPIRATKNGYAVVVQDCRGSMASEGEFHPFLGDVEDGYDTVEWAAAQPWCNSKVGMYGMSYLAITQWCAAIAQPPHLVAIFPALFPSNPHEDVLYAGGAPQLRFFLNWALSMSRLELARKGLPPQELLPLIRRIIHAVDTIDEQTKFLPLKQLPILREIGLASFYFDWLEHPDNDDYWQKRNWSQEEKIIVPAYHMAGWYDLQLVGTLSSYMRMKEKGGSELARRNQKLIIGPWLHSTNLTNNIGQLETSLSSMASIIDFMGIQLRWFDYWLKRIDNGIMDEPPIRIFVMGDNVGRFENEWPLARTQYTNYYLHSNGNANSLKGDGTLSTEPPSDEEPDKYLYDPKNPVPTKGGNIASPAYAGAFDQKEVEERADVLVYTTQPLEKDLEVTGPITVKLYAASSATDTDFTAKLVDVWPDGRAYNIQDGIIRARYRESTKKQSLIEPGKVYEYTITLQSTSNVFKAGHRIRVDISSSNSPRYNRNPNTGRPFGEDTKLETAMQRVFHDRNRASHIVLPVIPTTV